MIDIDAPSKTNPIYSDFIHLLIINNKETIIDYMSPNPPKNSGEHRYYIYIFEQPKKFYINIDKRNNFNTKQFILNYKLKKIDEFMFKAIYP